MQIQELATLLNLELRALPAERQPADCLRADFAGHYALDAAGEIVALNLRGTQLRLNPGKFLDALPGLRYLNLSWCGLLELRIPQLPELIVFDISQNDQLTTVELPATFPQLLRADLGRCNFLSIHWPACPRLEWLDAGQQQEQLLKDWQFTGPCPRLRYLYLRETGLESLTIPEGFAGLRVIALAYNSLTELTIAGELPELEDLDLAVNRLRELPQQAFPRLTNLYVRENPLKDYEERLINGDDSQNATEIIAFLKNIERSGKVPNHRLKLIVVGNGRSGKTCLVQRLGGEPCRGDESYTHGVSITRLTEKDLPGIDVDRLDLRVWDFGGQQVFHAIHQFFLSEEAIYIYVWTDRRIARENQRKDTVTSPQKIGERWRGHEEWLANIRLHGKNSPILPVRTHCRDARAILPIERLRKAFELKYDPLDFDARHDDTDFYVSRLKSELGELVAANPLLGRKIPRNYDKLIRALEAKRTSRNKKRNKKRNPLGELSLAAFAELMETHQIAAEFRDELLGYLHKTSEVIYYPDNERLRKRVFFDPAALTTEVYRLLKDHDEMTRRCGHFDAAYAKAVFGDEHWETLLALMLSYELVFPHQTDRGEVYVAPQYLPELAKTSGVGDLWAGHKLGKILLYELRYEHFIPENVMVNFISRFGPYALRSVYADAIYFARTGTADSCVIERIEEAGKPVIQVYAEDTPPGNKVADDVLTQFRKLSGKAELQIADRATRRWAVVEDVLEAIDAGERIKLLENKGKLEVGEGFTFLRARKTQSAPEEAGEASRNQAAVPGQKTPTPPPKPKRILFICSRPLGEKALDFGREFKKIEEARKKSEFRDHYAKVDIETAVEADQFVNKLLEYSPDILHIAMHGSKQFGLYFEDAAGNPEHYSAEHFALAIETYYNIAERVKPIELIVLNACNSLAHAEAVLPYVKTTIGMRAPVYDKACPVYAEKFYEMLFAGYSFKKADRLARFTIQRKDYPQQDKIPFAPHEIPVINQLPDQ